MLRIKTLLGPTFGAVELLLKEKEAGEIEEGEDMEQDELEELVHGLTVQSPAKPLASPEV